MIAAQIKIVESAVLLIVLFAAIQTKYCNSGIRMLCWIFVLNLR